MIGNLTNRLMENDKTNVKIEVGTMMTEYLYSDRNVWEVIEVKNQKCVKVRQMSARHKVAFSNDNVELYSDKNNRVMELVFRYGSWYEKYSCSDNNTDYVKYDKVKVVFGRADYYYDFEF